MDKTELAQKSLEAHRRAESAREAELKRHEHAMAEIDEALEDELWFLASKVQAPIVVKVPGSARPVADGAAGAARPNGPLKRGEIDRLMAPIVLRLPDQQLTVPTSYTAAEEQYPEAEVTRSGVRSYFSRQVDARRMKVVHEGGRGSSNPRVYGIVDRLYYERLAGETVMSE